MDHQNRTESEEERVQFQIELEFVQCLANPNYLNFLAQRGYFSQKSFVNYLGYLQYWKEPMYAKYLRFPACLHFLELLQHERFRTEIANQQCAKFVEDQQLLHWQQNTRKRERIEQEMQAASQTKSRRMDVPSSPTQFSGGLKPRDFEEINE